MRMLVALLACSLALADDPPGTKAEGDDTVEYFDLTVHATHVLYVIDVSSSMFLRYQGEKEIRVERMKVETEKSLRSLSPKQSFAVVLFAKQPHPWKKTFVHATKENIEAAVKTVKSVEKVTGTELWDAIQCSFGLFDSVPAEERGDGFKPAVFFLTDGWVSEMEQRRIGKGLKPYLEKWKPTLNVVSFVADSPFLSSLAKDNGGKLTCPVK